jgi:hypothetical protein
LPPHGLTGTPCSSFDPYSQRHLSRFWLVFSAPKSLEFQAEFLGIYGQKNRTRSLNRLAEWSFLEPFRERSAGPKHTRAEQDQN